MRSTWNPTKRNRNIGTAKQGYGQKNRLVIPQVSGSLEQLFYSLSMPYTQVKRSVNGHVLTFIVQRTRPGWFYSCTVDDICRMLGYLPVADLRLVDVIVLHQCTRKENILS